MTDMTTSRKKLIEVALPLDAINKASAREKSIRHGHPSTLHLWWARRPLAAARAVIFAQMVDDPSEYVDVLLSDPKAKRAAQRELSKRLAAHAARRASADDEAIDDAEPVLEEVIAELERDRLFAIIEELVQWENTTNEAVLQRARDEIWQSWRRACAVNAGHPRARELFDRHKLPAFHDPFAGGGALPLEAQRLGLESYASDLNPVAVLINKAMIEIPPKFAGRPPVNPESRRDEDLVAREWRGAQGLAADVRYYGQWMRDEAEKRIGWLYPKVEVTAEMTQARPDLEPYAGQKLTVIACLWARTVRSPNPAFANVDVPLASTFMLSTKKGKEAYVEPVIENGGYCFKVKVGRPEDVEAAKAGTKLARGANFRCLMSGTPMSGDYIKAEGKAGRMGARLMAIVAEGDRGRIYLAPTADHETAARQARPEWQPDLNMPRDRRWFSPPLYGLPTYGDLFTARPLVALTTFSDLVGEAMKQVRRDGLSLGSRASCPRQSSESVCSEGETPSIRRETASISGETLRTPRVDALHVPSPGVAPSTSYHRTHLPHFEAGEVPQHLCFRLADSLPQSLLRQWEEELLRQTTGEAERKTERRRRIEAALDRGYGASRLRCREVAAVVRDALLHFDGERYRLHEWVIMPNHVHVLATPLPEFSLSSVVHSWKSWTAKRVNEVLGRRGEFWHQDYFDRFIRDEAHYRATVEYIHRNPVAAGLCRSEEDWPWSSRTHHTGHPWDRGHPALDKEADAFATRARRPRSQEEAGLVDGGTGARGYAEAVGVYLGLAISRFADRNNALCTWDTGPTGTRASTGGSARTASLRNLFSRQAIPMAWDYGEANPFSDSGGGFSSAFGWIEPAIRFLKGGALGSAKSRNAPSQVTSRGKIVSTDPPYYDNIGYAKVLDTHGNPLPVRDALVLINQTLDEVLAEQEGDFDADTRWALAWFEQCGFDDGEYGFAETLSKAKNTSVGGLVEAGILASKGGTVRLLKPDELPDDWDPAADPRLTTWEMVHHLVRVLESSGESAAAELAATLGAAAETARELCYRLYTLCERSKRAAEALSYNALVQSWPEIARLAREEPQPEGEQAVLFAGEEG